MKNITSLKNPAVQDARALAAAKERSRQRAFLLDGEHMVGEGLHNCPERVKTVFVDEKRIADYEKWLALAQGEVFAVPEHVLAAISQVKTPHSTVTLTVLAEAIIGDNGRYIIDGGYDLSVGTPVYVRLPDFNGMGFCTAFRETEVTAE